MVNSKQKGKRAEREAAKFLQSLGFADARRGQQFRGGEDSPDVICDSLGVHLEVKNDQSIDIGTMALDEACSQALRDAKGKPWAVLWKHDRKCWRLTFHAQFFADLSDMSILTVAEEPDIWLALKWLQKKGGSIV